MALVGDLDKPVLDEQKKEPSAGLHRARSRP